MTARFDFPQRKAAAMTARPATRARKRAKLAAEAISRLGWARASAELCNEALGQFLQLCYAYDPDAEDWPHIDTQTGVILIPAPMSSRNYTKWALRRTEADALRLHLLAIEEEAHRGGEAPALYFDAALNRWFLNVYDYSRVGQALAWWARHEMTAQAFARYSQALRKSRRTRRPPRRNGRGKP